MVRTMLERSPTFRRQCARLAAAGDRLTIELRGESRIWDAARRPGRRSAGYAGGLHAVMTITPAGHGPELIAHEVEHVIEQMDGVDLANMSRMGATGVRQCDCGDFSAFETTRAIRDRPEGRARSGGSEPVDYRDRSSHSGYVRVTVAWLTVASGPGGLVTVAQGDATRSARAPRSSDVSADGRFVAFESWVQLVPADVDRSVDIYVLDRVTGRATLESSGLDAECSHPRINGDGRYVVYEARFSASSDSRLRIALRDRAEDTVRLLTTSGDASNADGWSRSPDISDDGAGGGVLVRGHHL